MERENFTPDELTQQGQNAYSSDRGTNMPDGGGSSPENASATPLNPAAQEAGGVATAPPEKPVEQQISELENFLVANPQAEVGVRRAVMSSITDLSRGVNVAPTQPQSEGPRSSDLQAQKAMEAMLGGKRGRERPTIREIPSEASFSDPALVDIIASVRGAGKGIISDSAYVDELEERARAVENSSPESAEEARELLEYLGGLKEDIQTVRISTSAEARGIFQLSLTSDEMDRIEADPIAWLDDQMDELYAVAKQGSELDSPFVNSIQSRVDAGGRFLQTTMIGKDNPEVVEELSTTFLNRLNLLFARSTIQQKNMEGIGGIAKRVQMQGLMNTLRFDKGLVNKMHNRINQLYDDTRIALNHEHHITPDAHSKIQQQVIDEYFDLISKDDALLAEVGATKFMSKARKEKVARATIRRSTRTAYDHFVASQREAVIVARGDALPFDGGLEGILADPSALFQMFNFEQLLIAKFGSLNFEEQEFFQAVKRRYAESILKGKKVNIKDWAADRIKIDPHIQKHAEEHHIDSTVAALEDYGAELVKDLLGVNDLYSSGWKLDEFMKQLDDNMAFNLAKNKGIKLSELSAEDKQAAYEKAKEFALFMRLRAIHAGGKTQKAPGDNDRDETKDKEKRKVWAKIAQYKPEEVVKMFREHGDAAGEEMKAVNQAFIEAGITLDEKDHARHFTLYDKFREDYAGALSIVREQGYASDIPEQVDFSQIMSHPRYAEILNKTLGEGEAQKIATLFGKLSAFASDKSTVEKLMKDSRFSFVYIRTQTVEDGLLDRMELDGDDETGRITTLSKKLSVEPGGDAYVRTFNDAAAAAEAHGAFLTFLMAESTEDKLKAARTAAGAVKKYRDPTVGALAFRYTFGSYLLMGNIADGNWLSKGTILELADIKKLPANKAINELQRIFGHQAPAFNNDDLNHYLLEYKNDLIKGGHNKEEALALWEEMRRLCKTRSRDKNRIMAVRGLIFAMLYIIAETVTDVKAGLEVEGIS